MKIACLQMDIKYGEPDANREKAKRMIEEAAENGADVIVLPEMWNTGYQLDELGQIADQDGQNTKELLSALAAKYQVNIIGGSVSVKRKEGYYNSMFIFDRQGNQVGEYDKAHLFTLMDEHHYLEAGQRSNFFPIDGMLCGGVICYDIRFPEWIRKHALGGANILFVPAEWPKPRIDHWEILLKARAIENQMYVVAVNRVGTDPKNIFNGHSMVIAPWGEVILNGGEEEGIGYAEVDLDEVRRVRELIPVYKDRRESLYE